MKRTVNLVATRDAILKYFPDAREPHPAAKPGIMSADFPLVPELCETALGRWLAERIHTTRFEDDAAACKILLPATELGLHVREMGQQMLRHSELNAETAEALFGRVTAWIERQRRTLKMYGSVQSAYRTIQFEWPVFGSAKAKGAATPEAYFDECAKQIRMTGGIVLRAGFKTELPPDSLLQTMARDAGGGLALLERYRATDPYGFKKRAEKTSTAEDSPSAG